MFCLACTVISCPGQDTVRSLQLYTDFDLQTKMPAPQNPKPPRAWRGRRKSSEDLQLGLNQLHVFSVDIQDPWGKKFSTESFFFLVMTFLPPFPPPLSLLCIHSFLHQWLTYISITEPFETFWWSVYLVSAREIFSARIF